MIAVCLLFVLVQPQVSHAADPWQATNERIYRFNSFFDEKLLRPIATAYDTLVPRVVRQGIGNFFSNINDINVFANDLLQLKFKDAATDSGRFLVNSTVGIVGIIDVASSVGLPKNEEDFGQTFGRWDVSPGPYVVLPFLGPSSVRDSFGLVLDAVFNPIQYHEEASVRSALWALDMLDQRASVLSMQELISGDEYLFVREAYLQRRQYLVNDGESSRNRRAGGTEADQDAESDEWDDFDF